MIKPAPDLNLISANLGKYKATLSKTEQTLSSYPSLAQYTSYLKVIKKIITLIQDALEHDTQRAEKYVTQSFHHKMQCVFRDRSRPAIWEMRVYSSVIKMIKYVVDTTSYRIKDTVHQYFTVKHHTCHKNGIDIGPNQHDLRNLASNWLYSKRLWKSIRSELKAFDATN